MRGQIVTILLFVILLIPFFIPTATSAQIDERTQNIMDEINKKRTEQKLEALKIDENLCKLAQKISEDSERNYPDEFTGSFQNYKEYLKDFSSYKSSKLTYNDILVKTFGNQKLSIDDEFLISSFTSSDGSLGAVAMDPELNYGCLGVSSGEIGYKPFAYFIGGIKKEAVIPNNINFFQVISNWILSFFK